RHCFVADHLAIALAAVEREQRAGVKLDLRMLVHQHAAFEQRIDVARDHADAVRVVAHEIGCDEVLGHHARLARIAAALGDDRLDRARERRALEDRLHSGLIPPRCTTLVQRSTSSAIKVPNASGVLATTSKPICVMRSRMSAERSALTEASFSFATISRGVFAGAATACQEVTTRSGKPASTVVGTSGSCGWRVFAVTASAFMR